MAAAAAAAAAATTAADADHDDFISKYNCLTW